MGFFTKAIVWLLVLSLAVGGGGWLWAGMQPGPAIEVTSPGNFVGQKGTLAFAVASPDGLLSRVEAVIEQNGQTFPVYSLAGAAPMPSDGTAATLQVEQPIGKQTQPALVSGPARLVIRSSRPVLFGLRTVDSEVTRDFEIRLDPPRVSVASLHHFVNLGGAEFVVLNVTPQDAAAGIRVGDAEYPAFPGIAVGLSNSSTRVAFFALRHDQSITTPIMAFARDPAGNEVVTPVGHKPFNKAFVKSRIEINQAFLQRVVPAIAANTPNLTVDTSSTDGLLKGFLTINGDLRRANAATIVTLAAKTAQTMLWKEAFAPMGNAQVESRFADQRTYYFEGKEIDRQVHLGFDLASVQQAPVLASSGGAVVFADFLGIYGNCVILDHGLGVQTLYAHLSSLAVKPGDPVTKGQELGRTGITGLAGGDHLHFTTLLHGTPINPVEWWDPHWMEDRVFRKIREAGGGI